MDIPQFSAKCDPEFIARCDRYCEAAGKTRVWLSKRLFSDTNRLDDLAAGKGDVGVKRLARAVDGLRELEKAHREASAEQPAAA